MKKHVHYFNKSKYTMISLSVILFLLIFQNILFYFLNILNIYSNAALAIVAILGLLFGQSWINTSKKKMKGQLDFDIARKYLKSVLKLRDGIKIVRNPFVSSSEMQSSLQKNGFSVNDYEDKEKVNRSVYSVRWEKIQETWTSLDEVLLDAEVSWGNESVEIQKGLDGLVRKLRSVIWLFVNSKEAFETREENENILYGTHDESDEFAKNINKEVEKIRDFLKKHL